CSTRPAAPTRRRSGRRGPSRTTTSARAPPRTRRSPSPPRSPRSPAASSRGTSSARRSARSSCGRRRRPPGWGCSRSYASDALLALLDPVLSQVGAHVVALHSALARHLAHVPLRGARQAREVLALERRDRAALRLAERGGR